MAQKQVAERLGLTRPAMSKYLTWRRCTALQLEQLKETREIAEGIVSLLAGRGARGHEALAPLVEACEVARKGRYMCTPHSRLEPTPNVNKCHAQLKLQQEEVSKLAERLRGKEALVVPPWCEA